MTKASSKSETVAAVSDTTNEPRLTITADDIARRAYDFYLARGCEPGHDVEDWLHAERELSVDEHC